MPINFAGYWLAYFIPSNREASYRPLKYFFFHFGGKISDPKSVGLPCSIKSTPKVRRYVIGYLYVCRCLPNNT